MNLLRKKMRRQRRAPPSGFLFYHFAVKTHETRQPWASFAAADKRFDRHDLH